MTRKFLQHVKKFFPLAISTINGVNRQVMGKFLHSNHVVYKLKPFVFTTLSPHVSQKSSKTVASLYLILSDV